MMQTYKDLEILVVDDCSTDSSISVAEKFRQTDSRIRIVTNHENIGLFKSRRRGANLAKGKYTAFVDADDWMQPEAIERLHSAITAYNVDLVQMRIQRRFKGIAKKYNDTFNRDLADRRIDGEEFRTLASYVGMDSYIQPSCCAKLYRTTLLKEAPTLEFNQFWGEDQIFNIQYLRTATSIAFIDCVGYNYRWGGDTVTNYRFSSLRDYKHVHYLKRILGQDENCINEEIIGLLRYYVRQLLTDSGWTREALERVLEDELRDPLWEKAGLQVSASELIDSEQARISRHPWRYLIKRFLR